MPKRPPSAARTVVIAGFALSCFGLLLFLWLAFGGSVPLGPKGYRFQVAFPDAATLADQSDVRVAGVNVGKVVLREKDGTSDRTLATIELDEKYAPVRRDARAMLRQKTLLGETYVELELGSKGAPGLPENGRLPNGAVREAVEFDELLTTFDEDTRKALQEWQATTARATRGRAVDLNDALGSLPVFAESGQTLVDVLNRRRDALRGVVRDTGTTFDALNRDAGALQQMITRSDEVLTTLAARRSALAESVQIFPTFLDETRRTLTRVDRFGKDTNPLLRDLEPVLEDAQPTLRSLAQFAPDAQRLFEDLPALISAGRQGLPALSRVCAGWTRRSRRSGRSCSSSTRCSSSSSSTRRRSRTSSRSAPTRRRSSSAHRAASSRRTGTRCRSSSSWARSRRRRASEARTTAATRTSRPTACCSAARARTSSRRRAGTARTSAASGAAAARATRAAGSRGRCRSAAGRSATRRSPRPGAAD
jgi:virulence factor Mce-like protein